MVYPFALFFGTILLGFAWKASGSGKMYAGRGRYVAFDQGPYLFGFHFFLSVVLGICLCLFGLSPIIFLAIDAFGHSR